MSNQTAHYGLNQWSGGDNFLRTDFNEDNAKIDAALTAIKSDAVAGDSAIREEHRSDSVRIDGVLAQKSEVTFGTYTGGNPPRAINLGFQPKGVILERTDGFRGNGVTCGGIFYRGQPLTYSNNNTNKTAEVTATGFSLYADCVCQTDVKYHYIAFH